MDNYSKKVEIRWSDLDPNFHVRHSVYYDMGAFVRMSFLTEFGLSAPAMMSHHIGPILFREECLFKREIRFGDDVSINLWLSQASPSYSRWTIQHEIFINHETLAAQLTVDGAWIDTSRRKLTIPTEHVSNTFGQFPRKTDFKWL